MAFNKMEPYSHLQGAMATANAKHEDLADQVIPELPKEKPDKANPFVRGVDEETAKERLRQIEESGLPDTEDDLRASIEEKVKQDNEQAELKQKLERQIRLRDLTKQPDWSADAEAFLLDMAGIQPFEKTYQPFPWLSVTFTTTSASEMEEIAKQARRDIVLGRYQYMAEIQFDQTYRLVASLKQFTLIDPQSKKVLKAYSADLARESAKTYQSDNLVDSDTIVRKHVEYFTHEVCGNSQLYQMISLEFTKFQTRLDNLAFLAREDADFFTKCLGGES